jgi:maltose alpha-D-glucosyltransferase / alpha-amylase
MAKLEPLIAPGVVEDPLWYKDAIIYEVHVRAFRDGNGDGIGDFAGLVEKLDYLQDLGVTAIWLLPFYPSPLRDDGYDIADYTGVNPSYGSLTDFRRFLREAHRRGIRVITELVLNHTSSDHPWFQRARRAPKGSRWRDYYVWSDSSDRYREARVIFQDFEASNWSWDPVAGAYYWHRFYHHQPDLNFENPAVVRAVLKTLDFWMEMGVDGVRLDAVPYLFEREGTNCENLPETHALLRRLRRHLDARFANRMILAEANQWPEDAAAYFGAGDECHMSFHFPVMPRMFMALQLESAFPILDILDQTPSIPGNCQWAVFLRNHDELTLEMVTDEDRDYMYRMYATEPKARINLGIRRRLAPLMRERRKIELMNGLLLSLPGTPVIYYGDEIGMGDNIYLGDRDGVRTPMQWSADLNAGFSRANPQRLYLPVIIDPEHHYAAVNVEAQQHNPDSLLWWMKRAIALRKENRVFSRGEIEFLHPENHKVLAFVRSYGDERLLAVFNLARFPQHAELDLGRFEGAVPLELMGRTEFPRIGATPYSLTLGPHEFFWFRIERPAPDLAHGRAAPPQIDVAGDWRRLFTARMPEDATRALTEFLGERRWFRGRAAAIASLRVKDAVECPPGTLLLLLAVEYLHHGPEAEIYLLTVTSAEGAAARRVVQNHPEAVIAHLPGGGDEAAILYDPLAAGEQAEGYYSGFATRRLVRGLHGRLQWHPFKKSQLSRELPAHYLGFDQSNTNLAFGEDVLLKMYRKLEHGTHPDVEVCRFLRERARYTHCAEVLGWISYRAANDDILLALAQRWVPNQGDVWALTLEALDRYFEQAVASSVQLAAVGDPEVRGVLPDRDTVRELVGSYGEIARLIGTRTAELHVALASDPDDPAFRPEPFTQLHQRSLYQSARTLLRRTFVHLLRERRRLPEDLRALADRILARRGDIDDRLRRIVGPKLDAVRIRCHGDYHLGQLLYTGKDFIVIDFEGEPGRSIGERRLKRSPLRDVAGMIRSFHYAAMAALEHGAQRRADVATLRPWASMWVDTVSEKFLRSYLEVIDPARLLPRDGLDTLLDFHLIEKCIYEIEYELSHRPDWLGTPLRGLSIMLGDPQ